MSETVENAKKNMRERFIASNFDEVDMVLDTDRRFDEAIAAAEEGEEDLVNAILKEMSDNEEIHIDTETISEDDITEYNPEDDDAIGIEDTTAEDYREYVSEEDYGDEDGEMIDQILGHDPIEASEELYDDEG